MREITYMHRITEKEIENRIALYLREIGCAIVRTEVEVNMRNRRSRVDLVGFVIDEFGKSVPKVVVEIRPEPAANSQQQLYEYARALDCPYALLVINENKYWFDGVTLLPLLESPIFVSESRYIEDVAEIKNQLERCLWSVFDGSGRLISFSKGIAFLASGLLIRSYLSESDEREISEWLQIESEEQYKKLLIDAFSYFDLEENLATGELPISIERWINLLTDLPPLHKSLGEGTLSLVHDVIAKEGKNGEYISPQHIRSAFKEIIAGLDVTGNRAIDLAAGYSSVSFDIYSNELLTVKSFKGYEIIPEVCGIAQVISIISGFKHLKYVCSDVLLLDVEENHEKYSLVIIDPPLGSKAVDKVEYDKFELTRRSRNAKISDLMIEQALNLSEPGGYVVALVPEGTLFSSGSSSVIRELIKEQAILEGIISLPSHTMKPFTGAKVSILVLRKKKNATETAKELFLGNPKSVDDILTVIEEFHNWRRSEGEGV